MQSVKCCVLYNRSDGKIHHLHRVLTIKGADETSKKDVEQRTLELAKELGINMEAMKLLDVDESSIEPGKRYVVDVNNQRLKEIKVTIN